VAIISFPASYQTPIEGLIGSIRQFALNGKQQNEVLWSFETILIWQEWFVEQYGELKELRHRSGGDDPPDLNLVFKTREIGFEYTALKPYPLGYAEAIASEINPKGSRILPGISLEWTRDKLERLASGNSAGTQVWSNASDDYDLALRNLIATVQRKLCDSESDIICVRDDTTFLCDDFEGLALRLSDLLNSQEFQHAAHRTVILVCARHSLSALVRRAEALRLKRTQT
jgi:hypothetical protein